MLGNRFPHKTTKGPFVHRMRAPQGFHVFSNLLSSEYNTQCVVCKYINMLTCNNHFKNAVLQGQKQIGFWLTLDSPTAAEICAGAGFDWVVIDAEHGFSNERSILAQLQALGNQTGVHPVVRVPTGLGAAGQVWVGRVLDLGVQTLLIPMVDTVEQAKAVVQAARYPDASGQGGRRGVASMRAAAWGRRSDYMDQADENLCIVVQAETRMALDALESIATVDGVDAVFLGPADLSASLGYRGNTQHPEVMRQMEEAVQRILAVGKPVGSISIDLKVAQKYLDWGMSFVAVGVDIHVLSKGTDLIRGSFK